jgi:hypothetical protein
LGIELRVPADDAIVEVCESQCCRWGACGWCIEC